MIVDASRNPQAIDISACQMSKQSGLTLVEMLIALVLSSIIFVSAYQVISNLVQYQVRSQAKSEESLDRLLATNMVSQIIEKGISQYDLFYRAQKASLFQGETNSLQLISRAYYDRYDRPGYRVYRLFQRDGELTISYQAYDRDYQSGKRFELATGLKIKEIGFAYFEAGDWVDEWTNERTVPEFIRVKIDFTNLKSTEFTRGTSRR
jgi:prepilin-type N-terminal cleavage/methylation domain-containing protein